MEKQLKAHRLLEFINSSHKPIMFGQNYKTYKGLKNYKFVMEILGVSNELKKISFIQLNSFIQSWDYSENQHMIAG